MTAVDLLQLLEEALPHNILSLERHPDADGWRVLVLTSRGELAHEWTGPLLSCLASALVVVRGGAEADDDALDDQGLSDLLLLVCVEVPPERLSGLTAEERATLQAWAADQHLMASDVEIDDPEPEPTALLERLLEVGG